MKCSDEPAWRQQRKSQSSKSRQIHSEGHDLGWVQESSKPPEGSQASSMDSVLLCKQQAHHQPIVSQYRALLLDPPLSSLLVCNIVYHEEIND